MAETQALDDEIVGSFEPAAKAWIVWDEEVSGFGVRVLPSGMRSWIVGYWGVRPGGKKGSRRLVIGHHGKMPVEVARRKAEEILAGVGPEEVPDGRPDEPVPKAAVEPDTAEAPPADEPLVEEAPGGAADDDPAPGAVRPAGEEHDPETGEIHPAAAPFGSAESSGDDISSQDGTAAARPGPEPPAGAGDAGGSDEPVGRSDEPAAEAGAEPDAAEAPPAEELRAEEAPVTAADDEPAAAAASPADEEHDPETDEIHPAGAPSGSAESSGDDVHPQDGAAAAGPGPAPPAGAGDAGVSDEPVGRSDEPAAGAGVEPDMAKASPADEPPAEQAPVTAAHDKPAAAAVTPAGEEYDPETGEIAPAGPQSGATQSFDDDIGLGDERAAAEAGPEPTARASDAGARDEMASRVVDEIVGQVQSAPGEGRLGPGTPTTDVPHDVPGNGEQRPADRLGDEDNEPASQDRQSDDMTESRDPEIPPGGDRQRAARGSAGPEETPPDVSGRSRTANVKKAMAGAVRRVARLGGKGGAENPAGGEAEGSAPDPREPPRSDAPAEADPTVARDPQRPPFREDGRMAEMRQRTAALEEKEEAAKEFSDQTVAAFAKNLDAARAQGDRIEAMVGTFGPRLDALSNALSVSTVDARRQKRRRLVRTALGAALLAAVGCAGGAAVQSQFPLLPQADPSLGWRDHIWNHYGSAFTACYDRARKDASGRVKCEIEVRGR